MRCLARAPRARAARPESAGMVGTSLAATDSIRPELTRGAVRRVLGAALVGTAVEWYDFFVYAISSGVVFGDLFFAPAGNRMAQIVAFATAGISFLFRPVGAIVARHIGDKYGRRLVLMLTLVLMGACTTLVGVVPVTRWTSCTRQIRRCRCCMGNVSRDARLSSAQRGPVRGSGFFSAMRASGPTTRPAHTLSHFIEADFHTAVPGLVLLGGRDPAYPLIACQRRNARP